MGSFGLSDANGGFTADTEGNYKVWSGFFVPPEAILVLTSEHGGFYWSCEYASGSAPLHGVFEPQATIDVGLIAADLPLGAYVEVDAQLRAGQTIFWTYSTQL